jgi:hypothetical protein
MTKLIIENRKKLLSPEKCKLFVGKRYYNRDKKSVYGIFHKDTVNGLKEVSVEEVQPIMGELTREQAIKYQVEFNEAARHDSVANIQINGTHDSTSPKKTVSEKQLEHIDVILQYIHSLSWVVDDDNHIRVEYEDQYTEDEDDENGGDIYRAYDRDNKITVALLVLAVQEFEMETGIKFYESYCDDKQLSSLKVFYFFDNDKEDLFTLKIEVRLKNADLMRLFKKTLKKHLSFVASTTKPRLSADYFKNRRYMEPFSTKVRNNIYLDHQCETDFIDDWED